MGHGSHLKLQGRERNDVAWEGTSELTQGLEGVPEVLWRNGKSQLPNHLFHHISIHICCVIKLAFETAWYCQFTYDSIKEEKATPVVIWN